MPQNECVESGIDRAGLPQLVLASSSQNRKLLLRRLVSDFAIMEPISGETVEPNERGRLRAIRLARLKAASIAEGLAHHLIIGSDQVAESRGRVLHKPGECGQATSDLLWSAGQQIDFWTGVCVRDTRSGQERYAVDHTRVWMREFTRDEILRYLSIDQPWGCAASFRAESLGPALFRTMVTRDPTALIGLPLIALSHLLRTFGYPLP